MIMGVDPGSNLGWATNYMSAQVRWGTEEFHLRRDDTEGLRWLRYDRWLSKNVPGVNVVVYEQQNNFGRWNRQSMDVNKTMVNILLMRCEEWKIPVRAVNLMTLKAYAIPRDKNRKKGDPNPDRSKDALIEKAKRRLQTIHNRLPGKLNEHEADALWLYWWAVENL